MRKPSLPEEPALVPGHWYMFAAPGGFTLVGEYVRPLGLEKHRFNRVTHMRNAGQHTLPIICREGQGNAIFVDEFPGCFNVTPLWWTDYLGEPPVVK